MHWAESSCHKQFCKECERCVTSWFLMDTCTSTDLVSISIRHLKPVWGSFPSTSFAYQKWPLSTLLQDNTSAFLTSSANFTPLQGVFLSLASLLPASWTCSAVGPSCPRRCMIKTWLSRGFQHMFNFSTWLKSLIYMWPFTFNMCLIGLLHWSFHTSNILRPHKYITLLLFLSL